jgi:hypothetical protein
MAGFVDHPHAASAQLFQHLIVAQPFQYRASSR